MIINSLNLNFWYYGILYSCIVNLLQANGFVERFNQTIQNMLVKFISQRKEDRQDYLDSCVYAYNTAKHESTKLSPYEVMFFRKGLLLVDYLHTENCFDEVLLDETSDDFSVYMKNRRLHLEEVKKHILKAQAMQKKQYDRRHHKPEIFKLGFEERLPSEKTSTRQA